MLQATLELSAGNMRVAAEACERLLKLQPFNMRARELLARTLYLSGQYKYLTLRFRGDIAHGDASPYLMSVVARAFEAEGDREQAGVLLDRAASPELASLRVVPQGSDVGALMSQGRTQEATAAAAQQRLTEPGSYQSYAILGDMELALGHAQNAQLQYTAASRIRMSDSLLSRRFQAYQATGDAAGAAAMMQSWLAQNPNSRTGLRLQALLALQVGDPAAAGAILSYLSATGGDQDVQLLSDLALARLQGGTPDAAEQAAGQAYRLQRGSPLAAQALALSYATLGVNAGEASALLAKARQMLGDNPILSQAEARLQQGRLPALAKAGAPRR
jgi:Flp pilus assembly protein TadD